MASVTNILGQKDTIKHVNKTTFDKTFAVTKSSDSSAFSLTSYTGTFKICDYENGTTLYSTTTAGSALTFSTNTFRLNDTISLQQYGKLYFELTITYSTYTYVIWYGDWFNYYNT